MNLFVSLTTIVFFIIVCESSPSEIESESSSKNTDVYLNALQTIRKYGYPSESHTVETADGYLLEIHRIPYGRNGSLDPDERRLPVFIQHGLLGSSIDFFLGGPEKSLPFLLSDLGFDVWLGNVRGNLYSRAHVDLFPNDRKFWNFTWHESAIYDIPAQIDFICNYTEEEKVIYLGYSMGTTMFFVMTSMLPEYNDKIEVSLLMAPVGYLNHIKSPFLRFLAPFSETIEVIEEFLSHGEFLPDSKLFKLFIKVFCIMSHIDRELCTNAIFLIVGNDPREFDEDLLPILISHYPEGYSAKALNHYAQLVRSGEFQEYDYGRRGNIIHYGMPTPPNYDVSSIKVPMYFYVGQNDFLSSMQDVRHLSKRLDTLRRTRVIDYPKFSHLDFLVSTHVRRFVYDPLIDDLLSYLYDDNGV